MENVDNVIMLGLIRFQLNSLNINYINKGFIFTTNMFLIMYDGYRSIKIKSRSSNIRYYDEVNIIYWKLSNLKVVEDAYNKYCILRIQNIFVTDITFFIIKLLINNTNF